MALTKGQKWGIFAGVAVGITAIGIYLKKQFDKIYNAAWTYGGVKNLKLGFDRISFTLFYNVDNKGDLSVIISEQDYDVTVNGVFVSKIKNATNVKIASRGITKIPFYVDFAPKDLLSAGLKNISDLLSNKQNVKILIKGHLNIKAGIISLKKYPFELGFTLADITGETTPQSGDVNTAT